MQSRIRVDIQILRAIAVLLVIAGHFWPGAFPGGFAGVDVFFVISGFLITSLMVNEIGRTGRLSLVNFWARRIRRIMPAALAVIATTAAAVVMIGSPDQIRILSRHVIASSLSAENLLLAWDSADYDRREDSTSPLQHFWSLAVEEQFYLVWPLVVGLVLALVTVSRRFRWDFRRSLTAVVVVTTLASFAYALSLDPAEPSSYFDPFARAWELGVGATVAVWGGTALPSAAKSLRYSLVIIAAAVIAGTAFVPRLNESTPGIGVVPAVLATAAVIALAVPLSEFRGRVPKIGVSALTWIGDRSYSLYLWHWPFLLLAPIALQTSLDFTAKLLIVVVVVAVSALSYRFIEQPFRSSDSPVIRRPRFLFPVAAFSTIALIAGTSFVTAQTAPVDLSVETDTLIPSFGTAADDPLNADYPHVSPFCFGAGAAVFDCPEQTTVSFGAETFPINPVETPTCTRAENGDYTQCVLGETTSPRSIAIVGDSHAKALWVAGDSLGKRVGVAVHVFLGNGCAYSVNQGPRCTERNQLVDQRMLSGEFEFVIFAQSVARREGQIAVGVSGGFQQAYRELINAGVPFAVLKDNPRLENENYECFQQEFRNPTGCAVSRDRGFLFRDFAFEAATELGVPTIDFTDIYCGETKCPLAIGGVRVYRDLGHLTTVFGKSLVPFLENDLTELGFLPMSLSE